MQSLGRLHSSTAHHTGLSSRTRGAAAVVPVPVQQQHAAVAAPLAAQIAALRQFDAPAAAWGASSSGVMAAGCLVPRPVSNSSSSNSQQVGSQTKVKEPLNSSTLQSHMCDVSIGFLTVTSAATQLVSIILWWCNTVAQAG